MLKDPRTWTTIAYFVLMLPIGIVYFVTAVVGLALSLTLTVLPIIGVISRAGGFGMDGVEVFSQAEPAWLFTTWFGVPFLAALGILLLTSFMHLARGVGRLHALFAKSLLVARIGPDTAAASSPAAPLAAH